HEDEQDQDRCHRHQGSGHHHRVVDHVLPVQGGDPHRQRPMLGAAGDHQRPQQVVPRRQRRDDRQGSDGGAGQGQHHLPEDLEGVRPVEPRRLLELPRQVHEELPHGKVPKALKMVGMTMPGTVSSHPRPCTIWYCGIRQAWLGIIRMESITAKIAALAAKRIRAKAYPAMLHSTTWPTTVATVTCTETQNWSRNGIWRNTSA